MFVNVYTHLYICTYIFMYIYAYTYIYVLIQIWVQSNLIQLPKYSTSILMRSASNMNTSVSRPITPARPLPGVYPPPTPLLPLTFKSYLPLSSLLFSPSPTRSHSRVASYPPSRSLCRSSSPSPCHPPCHSPTSSHCPYLPAVERTQVTCRR